ncbi:DMT family transporter [Aeromonas bivalvium]|uniref:DMT family transporter n=1 Tax=Aeromonas bivalvium TaxID=440079 RepID=UPI003D21ABD1
MLLGVLFALLAGLMWGLIFVAPLLVDGYPPALLASGRYLAFGLIVLPLAWRARKRLAALSASDWREALALTLVGNLVYYFCLSGAILRIGSPLAAMLIGTLPVVTALAANRLYGAWDGRLSRARLYPALLLMAAGLYLVNRTELTWQAETRTDQLLGLALAVAAVLCWTWYPLRNARWLREHPGRSPALWATAQGLVTLPVALVAYLGSLGHLALSAPDFPLPFGPTPLRFVLLMGAVGLFCSWLGTLCWNEASQRLPTVLVGPLIVFETLAGLLYVFMLRGAMPPMITLAGVVCLVAGVLYVLAGKPRPQPEKRAKARLT